MRRAPPAEGARPAAPGPASFSNYTSERSDLPLRRGSAGVALAIVAGEPVGDGSDPVREAATSSGRSTGAVGGAPVDQVPPAGSTVRAPDPGAWAARPEHGPAEPSPPRSRRLVHAAVLAVVVAAATATWLQVVARLREPESIAVRGTPAAIVWADRVFRSEAELASYLRRRGVAYERWIRTHPAAVAILRYRNRPPAAQGPASRSPRAEAAAASRQAPEDEPFVTAFAVALIAFGLVVAGGAVVVAAAGRAPLLRTQLRLPSPLPALRRPRPTLQLEPVLSRLERMPARARQAAAGLSAGLRRVAVFLRAALRRRRAPAHEHASGTVVEDILRAIAADAPAGERQDRAGVAATSRSATARKAVPPAAQPTGPSGAAAEGELKSKLLAASEAPAVADARPVPRPRPHPEPATREPAFRPVADPEAAAPSCAIRWWRGYLKSQFCAVATDPDGAEVTIAQSPFFRWRQGTPPPEESPAVEALGALVASLERDGWTVAGRAGDWFALLLRAPGAAPPAEARDEG